LPARYWPPRRPPRRSSKPPGELVVTKALVMSPRAPLLTRLRPARHRSTTRASRHSGSDGRGQSALAETKARRSRGKALNHRQCAYLLAIFAGDQERELVMAHAPSLSRRSTPSASG
jgi:hypothetical protein